MNNAKHLIWIVYGALIGFGASFIFGDLLKLPVDVYYLIYFGIIIGFFIVYIKKTQLNLMEWFSRRLIWGILLGIIFSALVVMNVLSRPATEQYTGLPLVWNIFWRGLVYGTVDGLLLTVFPWIVTWRAFEVEKKPLREKISFGFLVWFFVIVMTSAYHFGYSDFRSNKIIQPNIGNTLISVPTLLTANPIGSPLAHAALHISAIIHSPKTELFLPPHRRK